MAFIDIPDKSPGDTAFAVETNEIVAAILKNQTDHGWGSYTDDEYTDLAPQVFSSAPIWQRVENNAAGGTTDYLPGGDTPFSLYDGNAIQAPEVGSTFDGYIKVTIKTSNNDSYFDLGIDIGGSIGVLFINTNIMPKGTGIYSEFTFPVNGFMLGTFQTNGGEVVIRPKSGHTFSVYGAAFFISINSQPV